MLGVDWSGSEKWSEFGGSDAPKLSVLAIADIWLPIAALNLKLGLRMMNL